LLVGVLRFAFLFALLLFFALFPPDRFERFPLGFHPDVAVVFQHLGRYVTGDVLDRLVASATLRQLGY
jgi:hypothetical protein